MNLFEPTDPPQGGERFDTLLRHKNLQIERIVSSALTPPHAYVQAQDEWVLLAQGSATLVVDGQVLNLRTGDHVFLPAGTPHTVEQVSDGAMWLAVHLHPERPDSDVKP
jgi:cupin 2 domain-containing protein